MCCGVYCIVLHRANYCTELTAAEQIYDQRKASLSEVKEFN